MSPSTGESGAGPGSLSSQEGCRPRSSEKRATREARLAV